MITHTIALLDDMLLATAPDGDESTLRARMRDALSQLTPGTYDESDIVYLSGLTLFNTEEAAEEAGAEVMYSGCATGWLEDENGAHGYMAAARMNP